MTQDTIYSRFHRQVADNGHLTAIIEEGRRLTYADLDQLVDRIALKISALGDFPTVGIVMSHGAGMIAAMLAVLKCGGIRSRRTDSSRRPSRLYDGYRKGETCAG